MCMSVHVLMLRVTEQFAMHNAMRFAIVGYNPERLKSTTLKPEILKPCPFEAHLGE